MLSTADTLLAFSEWLDSQHLILGPGMNVRYSGDKRSHSDLVHDFMSDWDRQDGASLLAGQADAEPKDLEMVVLYGDEQAVDVVVSEPITARVAIDLLLLVADDPYVKIGLQQRGMEVAKHWNVDTLKAVGKWAASLHLRASDNDDVPIPPFPMVLNTAFGWPVPKVESQDGAIQISGDGTWKMRHDAIDEVQNLQSLGEPIVQYKAEQ